MSKKGLKFTNNPKIDEAIEFVESDEVKMIEEYIEKLDEQIRHLNPDKKPYKIVIEKNMVGVFYKGDDDNNE